jgi:hypothetical protein
MRPRRFPHLPVLAPTLALMLAGLLAGCASGPVKRVSEPTVSIQQLSVGTDGQWTVDLRLQNYSNVPMRFDRVALTLRTGEDAAGELKASPALTVGPESVDTLSLKLVPSAPARILIAGTLADRRSLSYRLQGTITAAAEDRKSREYDIKRDSALSPVPGLPGVMR